MGWRCAAFCPFCPSEDLIEKEKRLSLFLERKAFSFSRERERAFDLLHCSNGLLRSSGAREYECNFLLHDLAEDQKPASVNRNIVD